MTNVNIFGRTFKKTASEFKILSIYFIYLFNSLISQSTNKNSIVKIRNYEPQGDTLTGPVSYAKTHNHVTY